MIDRRRQHRWGDPGDDHRHRALETSKGNLPLALGLGIVLLSLVALVNGAAYIIGEAARRRLG